MHSMASDTELVEASRTGSRDAFAQIVERYQNLVCGVTYSATREVAASEDLAQETFLEAWQSLSSLNDSPRLRAWLCAIARNLSRNFLRRQLRNPLGRSRAVQLDSVEEIAHPSPTALDAAITAEELQLLAQAIEGLPESYREPLVLFYRQEQSMREVAEALDISEDAARQRVNRARQLLRAEMALVVERGLVRTRAGKAFTTAVVAALPAVGLNAALLAGGTATAAAAGKSGAATAAGKGAATAYGVATLLPAGAAMGALGGLLGGVAGAAGAWLGFKTAYNQARSTIEQKFLKRSALMIIALTVLLVLVEVALPLVYFHSFPVSSRRTFGLINTGVLLGYAVALMALVFWMSRTHARIIREAVPDVVPRYPGLMFRKWNSPRTTVYASMAGAIFGLMSGPIVLEVVQGRWASAALLMLLTGGVYAASVKAVFRWPDRYFAVGGWACLLLGPIVVAVMHSAPVASVGSGVAEQWMMGGQLSRWTSAAVVAFLGAAFLVADYRGRASGLRQQLGWRLSTAGTHGVPGPREIIAAFHAHVDTPEAPHLVTLEGENGWQYKAEHPMELQLFTVGGKQEGPGMLFFTARLKAAGLHGYCWLQMQVRVNGRDYFSRGHVLHESVSGDQDWTSVEIPFFLKRGQAAELVHLQLLVNGPGTAMISDVALARTAETA
jgi:RNA polymerase sigma factor (sigma-70 family)